MKKRNKGVVEYQEFAIPGLTINKALFDAKGKGQS